MQTPKQVGAVIKLQPSDSEMTMRASSPAFLQTPQAVQKFLDKYSIEEQEDVAANRLKSIKNEVSNPQLQRVSEVYGDGCTLEWLKMQLAYTFGMCGFDFTFDGTKVVTHVASLVMKDYPYLRVREIMLFLVDFEKGKFGDFASRFNAQKFFTALQAFLKVRADLMEQERQEAKAKEREQWAAKATPCPEHLSIAKMFNKKD